MPEEYVREAKYRDSYTAGIITNHLLDLPDPPTCILYPDDFSTIGGMNVVKNRGLKIAVLSNKPHAETINVIETLFGKGYFDIIQGQKPDVPIKPSPEGVFCILEQLQMTADEILYLGDTCTDMQTGKSAGAFTVGALWGFRDRQELEENHADAIIAHPLELLQYVGD